MPAKIPATFLEQATGRISGRAFVLMTILYRQAQDGVIELSDEDAMAATDWSIKSLRRVKTELAACRLVIIEPGNGRGHGTRYTILPPTEWVFETE